MNSNSEPSAESPLENTPGVGWAMATVDIVARRKRETSREGDAV